MEYEKIKVYVPRRVAEIIQKDAENFEFFKKDELTPNKNALLSTLIINYWQDFNEKQRQLTDLVNSVLCSNTYFEDDQIKILGKQIINAINKQLATNTDEKFDSLVAIKPTKETQPIINYIDDYLLNNVSLSEYFRNMFVAYTAMPQDMCEKNYL